MVSFCSVGAVFVLLAFFLFILISVFVRGSFVCVSCFCCSDMFVWKKEKKHTMLDGREMGRIWEELREEKNHEQNLLYEKNSMEWSFKYCLYLQSI